jgi:hypothetical protein
VFCSIMFLRTHELYLLLSPSGKVGYVGRTIIASVRILAPWVDTLISAKVFITPFT